MAEFNAQQAKDILDQGISKAQELLKDPSKVDDLLLQLEKKLKEIPGAGNTLADVPLMISMVKSYVTKEYTEVSPKVVASMISAMIYLVAGKDIIPDKTPLIGHLDDIAVMTAALKLCEPELHAFAAWRDNRN